MNKKHLTIWLMAMLLMTVAGTNSETKEIPTMTVGQTAQGFIYKADRYKSYHLVSVPTIDKKYLFITVTTEEIYNHLNISLLIYKQGQQTPLQKCFKDELDSCYIPKSIIVNNQTLFVVVQSNDNEEITYKLNTYWSDLEHINLNEEVRFMFSEKEQKQIYHLQLEGQEFKELRILIKPETRRYPFDKVKMYGTFGKDSNPSSQNYDFESFPLWQDAEGVYLFRQEIKELTMNLILYGMTETVYTLKCWISNKTHSDLPIDSKIYEYLQKSQRYLYHLQFKDNEGKYFYQTYVFRASIFNGDLDMKFYKDEQKKDQVTIFNPLMYMGDIQYIFHQSQLDQQVPNGLYIEVSSDTRITTYMMEFEGRTKTEALELNQHIYEFLYVQNIERAYIKVAKFGTEDQQDKKGFKVTLSQIEVQGTIGLSLYLCNAVTYICLGENYQNSTTSLSYEIRQVGTKKTYTFYMTQDMFTNVNSVEQHAIVLIVLKNQANNERSLTALEYNVGNRPEFLRENKPIEAHIKKNQLKIYKYVCQDPSIKKVKIHINAITGGFQAHTYRNIPSEEDFKSQKSLVLNGLVEITENLMKDPVVIVFKGIDSATFSIVVQPISENIADWSYITLSEDVQFKARIGPNRYEIFQIVPVSPSIYFDYKSTGTVHVCKINDEGVCVDEEALPSLVNSGRIMLDNFYDRKAYVRVSNPSSNRLVEVTTLFHSKKQDHCELIKVGELTRELFTEGKCLYSLLHSLEDYQVMIVHEEYGPLDYKMLICDKILQLPHKENDQERYYLSEKMIKDSCLGHSQNSFALYLIGDPSHIQNGKIINPEDLFIKFIIQPSSSPLMLPDGLGYKGLGKTTQLPVKKFSFKLLNKIDTSIVVTTRNKLYFLVKVIEGVYRDSVAMSLSDFHFSSPLDKYFFLDSLYLKIPGTELIKTNCNDCQLLIYLYSKEPVGEIVEYNIEVSQNFFMLEQNQKKKNYLTQYSKAFYGYKAKTKGTVIIQVSDNNMDCTELYASTKEYPDENNYIKRSFDGEIIIENIKEQPITYYITVLARQNCMYSIGANLALGERNLFKLERGILSHLSMKEGQVKYFTFKHLSDSPFKILSLHKYGKVQMYLNQTTHQEVADFATKKNINFEDFQYRAQHKNRLMLNDTSKYFCKGCLYILAVVASKHTESSLYLGDDQTKVPLSGEKVLNDILPETSTTTQGQFYPMQNGVLEVKVHSGKIGVIINYKDQEIRKTFEKVPEKQTLNLTLNLVEGYYGTATITIRAQQANSVYSLRIKSIKDSTNEDTGVDYTTVNPDQANYVFLSDRQSCMKGYLKAKDERIFVSFFQNEKDKLSLLQIAGTLNGQQTDISHDLTRNVMLVTFLKAANMDFVQGVPYQLCFSIPNDTLSAVVMQTEDASTLPQNVETLVAGKQTYDIYPEGQFLLDIFECRGSASVAYGSSKKQLQTAKEKVLEVVGMSDQTHAVKIQRGYFNMLLSITSPLALIRWLPIKENEEKGVGYYLYSAGSLKYDSVFGQINFIVQPIKAGKKKTKTKIVDIRYSLYVSNNEQDLQQAGLCQRYLPGSVMEYRAIHQQINTQEFKFSIDKKTIMKKYTTEDQQPENLFAMIVADLTLQTPDKSQEYYRFVYNQQEIPAQLFKPSRIEQFELIFIIVFLVVLTLTLFTCAFLCTKVFVPMIGRLRNRMLVEEGGLDASKDNKDNMKEQQNLEPPPSSDRQNINAMTAPETEEKMS